MSKYSENSSNRSKKERENSLTLEQYEMIAAFLKDGIKPSRKSLKNAGLTCTQSGGPDGGKIKAPFVRFRSIAKRLTLRESDGELIFKANSKIILPKNRFEDTILTAHKSNGPKHLNITRTIQKLSRDYTIGCRQFGISEEYVRMVIKKCNDGSCAKRNNAGMGVLKNFTNATSEQSYSHSKESTPSKAAKNLDESKSALLPKAQVANGIPVTLVKLPNGTFGIQPFISQNILSQVPFKQIPVCDLQALQSYPVQHVNTAPCSLSKSDHATGTLKAASTEPQSMPFTVSEMIVSNPGPIPVQVVKVGSRPLMSGQQMYVMNSTAVFIPNTEPNQTNPIDLSKTSTKPSGHESSVPFTSVQTALESIKQNNSSGNAFVLQDSHQNCFMPELFLDQNNNEIMLAEENSIVGQMTQKLLNKSANGLEGSFCHYSGYHGNSEEVIDLPQKGEEIVTANHTVDYARNQDLDVSQSMPGSSKLTPVPYKQIWHTYDDLVRQTNPYKRISMCIKDMRLDVMKSLAGCTQAAERMRKKMNYIQELITAQKAISQYFTDLQSAM